MLFLFGIHSPQILFLVLLYPALNVLLDLISLPLFGSVLLCTFVLVSLSLCVCVWGDTYISSSSILSTHMQLALKFSYKKKKKKKKKKPAAIIHSSVAREAGQCFSLPLAPPTGNKEKYGWLTRLPHALHEVQFIGLLYEVKVNHPSNKQEVSGRIGSTSACRSLLLQKEATCRSNRVDCSILEELHASEPTRLQSPPAGFFSGLGLLRTYHNLALAQREPIKATFNPVPRLCALSNFVACSRIIINPAV